MPEQTPLARELRTPTAAAIAGIVFAVILGAVMILVRRAIPGDSATAVWADDPGDRRLVQIAVALVPFAGIAFLWFVGVIRNRLGAREDRLFSTVFLGSGVLFVAQLFAATAMLGSVLAMRAQGIPVRADAMVLLSTLTNQVTGVFGTRMAAVFTLSVTSLSWRTGALPRWLGVLGLVTALLLMATPPLSRWTQLMFPIWVLAVSVHLLMLRSTDREQEQSPV